MKKSLLALAALTAFAGVASAQSSVTLFGVVDVNARNVKNNGSPGAIKSLSTDGMGSSRLGFRGVEDLGGGLRAGFWIEGSIAADTGTATGQTWQRRSTVSLTGGFGELRLGRDYTPTFWNHTVFDPFGTNGVGSQTNLMTQQAALGMPGLNWNAGTLVRANNTIGYFLPAMGGLYGQFQVAANEGPETATASNKYIGGRLGYAAGPFNVAAAYGKTELSGADVKAFNVGASWNLGFMTVMGQYHKYERGSVEQENALLGAVVPMGASTLKASFNKTGNADQIALGYLYSLSKRTTLYTHYARVANDGLARHVTGGASGATINATARDVKSTGYEFGINHTF